MHYTIAKEEGTQGHRGGDAAWKGRGDFENLKFGLQSRSFNAGTSQYSGLVKAAIQSLRVQACPLILSVKALTGLSTTLCLEQQSYVPGSESLGIASDANEDN